jgi:hypothetical protein
MREYSLSYEELMNIPYERFLELSKIISLENKEEKKEHEQQKSDMDKKSPSVPSTPSV